MRNAHGTEVQLRLEREAQIGGIISLFGGGLLTPGKSFSISPIVKDWPL